MYITIVGSRATPGNICTEITKIATEFAQENWIIRSGGANGADLAAELGVDLAQGEKEIYLPWKKFNGNPSNLIAPEFPNWCDALTILSGIYDMSAPKSFIKLHGRNVYQVLGKDLKSPSKALVCFTEGGKIVGGTATAINLALKNDIPVFNIGQLGVSKTKELLAQFL
jgi:hypothetical protein